jgi:hypothetical protein
MLYRFSGIVVVLLPLVIAWVLFHDWRAVRAADRSIAVQEAVVDSLRAELRDLEAQMKKAGEEIRELPESARMGRAVDEGRRIAKRQEWIEGLITRSRRRIHNLEATRDTAQRHAIRLALPLAAAWGVFGLVFRCARRRRPST